MGRNRCRTNLDRKSLCVAEGQDRIVHVTLATAHDPYGDAELLGGVENVFRHFAEGLTSRGHDVTMVCGGSGGDTTEGDVQVRRVPVRATIMRAPLVNLQARIPDSDIVHVAATYPFVTSSVLRAAQSRNLSSVLDFHFEPDPATRFGRLAAQAYRQIGPRAYRHAKRVLVRSHDYGRHAQSLRDVSEHLWTALPNGVDTERFQPHGPKRGDGHILFVGRLVPYKGLDTLLRALAKVKDAPPVWIAGAGPLGSELKSLARELRVDASFLGRVPDADLPALYRGARLTVLPSIGRQECFGITLLESMACGTPVLASDLPGVRAVAAMGGTIAPAGDVNAWSDALRMALDAPEQVDLANRIRTTCGWPAIVEGLEHVYQEIA